MSAITTHVLDIALGKPAAGVAVELLVLRGNDFVRLGVGQTDLDGRLRKLLPQGAPLEAGLYRIKFDTGAYFKAQGTDTFYPFIEITFDATNSTAHYHVPLLLSPFGYSTYRGS